MFTITEADDSCQVVQHDGSAIHVRTITTVIKPAEVSYNELTLWCQNNSVWDADMEEWQLESEEIGDFDSMGDDDIQTLVHSVQEYLEERGVTVRVPAST